MKILDSSFVRFVYPFKFEPQLFEPLAQRVDSAIWDDQHKEPKLWKPATIPKDEMMPHVARYFGMEQEDPAQPDDGKAQNGGSTPHSVKKPPETARVWEMSWDAMSSPRGLGSKANWEILLPNVKGGALKFEFAEVRLYLFRVGIGFLTLQVTPTSTDTEDWLDFLHNFRFTGGKRAKLLRVSRKTGIEKIEPYFPELWGTIAKREDGKGALEEIVRGLLKTASPDSADSKWWDDVFVPRQMLVFAALFFEEAGREEEMRMLYRARNFFHRGQGHNPSAEDLLANHPSLLPYAERQWFAFSIEGGVFAAFDAPDTEFFNVTLPHHIRDQYFLLYLLALHQRFVLMTLSEDVARHWPESVDKQSEEHAIAVFKRIRNALLFFTARGLFSQVMQHEHHHRCYRKWQEIFQIDRLYAEVNGEVQEMHNHLMLQFQQKRQEEAENRRIQLETLSQEEARRDRASQEQIKKLERRIQAIAVALAVGVGFPALVLAYFDAASDHYELSQIHIGTAIGIVVGCAAAIGLFRWLDSRGKSPKN